MMPPHVEKLCESRSQAFPVTLGTLEDHAQRVTACHAEVAAAQRAVAADKQRRATSIFSRLVDAVLTTNAEAALVHAQDNLDKHQAAGREAVAVWVTATALQEILRNPEQSAMHQQQSGRCQRASDRAGRVRAWVDLAREAENRIKRAQAECESAMTSEMFDAFSKSKTVSLMSSWSNDTARYAVRQAEKAVRGLAAALPKRAAEPAIDLPGEFFDTFCDIVFEPGLDVLTWLNLMTYEKSVAQCKTVLRKLQPLKDQLITLDRDVQDRLRQEQIALDAIEHPYRVGALALVPAVLTAPAVSEQGT